LTFLERLQVGDGDRAILAKGLPFKDAVTGSGPDRVFHAALFQRLQVGSVEHGHSFRQSNRYDLCGRRVIRVIAVDRLFFDDLFDVRFFFIVGHQYFFVIFVFTIVVVVVVVVMCRLCHSDDLHPPGVQHLAFIQD
jgi:hypothetical protein